jgi:hypothetical protein
MITTIALEPLLALLPIASLRTLRSTRSLGPRNASLTLLPGCSERSLQTGETIQPGGPCWPLGTDHVPVNSHFAPAACLVGLDDAQDPSVALIAIAIIVTQQARVDDSGTLRERRSGKEHEQRTSDDRDDRPRCRPHRVQGHCHNLVEAFAQMVAVKGGSRPRTSTLSGPAAEIKKF